MIHWRSLSNYREISRRQLKGEGKRRFKINIWAIVSDYFAVTPSSQLPCLWCTPQVDYWERRSSNNRKFKSYLHVASPLCYQNRCCGHSTLLFLEANVLKCMPLYKEVSAIRNAFLLACCPYDMWGTKRSGVKPSFRCAWHFNVAVAMTEYWYVLNIQKKSVQCFFLPSHVNFNQRRGLKFHIKEITNWGYCPSSFLSSI